MTRDELRDALPDLAHRVWAECWQYQADGIYKNCEWVRGVTRGTHEEDIENTKRRVQWLEHVEGRWLRTEDKWENLLRQLVIETLALWRAFERKTQ